MKQNNIITLLLVLIIIGGGIGFVIFKGNQKQEVPNTKTIEPSTTAQNSSWKTYAMDSASFSYPSDVLILPTGQSGDGVYLTNSEQVDSPMAMTENGIWVDATRYPSTAKDGLIENVQSLIQADNGTTTVHPITPYPDKFTKVKNLANGGVLLINTSETSGEMETALWSKNNVVYQLRFVVSKRSVFEDFKETFEKMAESFIIIN
jgi:hypothetical protein